MIDYMSQHTEVCLTQFYPEIHLLYAIFDQRGSYTPSIISYPQQKEHENSSKHIDIFSSISIKKFYARYLFILPQTERFNSPTNLEKLITSFYAQQNQIRLR